jgi:hypothetical protein
MFPQSRALPTTAVGKIVKNDLRDRAIEEKVRSEIAAALGRPVEARIQVGKDDKLNTVVRVELAVADPDARGACQAHAVQRRAVSGPAMHGLGTGQRSGAGRTAA